MEVELISYQQNAMELLIYSKNTRLQGASFTDICSWDKGKKREHLNYVFNTIPSSWEFVHYVFKISGVSRACANQITRQRTASFAQESLRTVPPKGDYFVPDLEEEVRDYYVGVVDGIFNDYEKLLDKGVPPQDARNILPLGTNTSLMYGVNLRSLSEMMKTRMCVRTQGETQEVFKLIREAVVKAHPFVEEIMQVHCIRTGTCCFPNFTECPHKKLTVSNTQAAMAKAKLKHSFEHVKFQATPVAVDGMSLDNRGEK